MIYLERKEGCKTRLPNVLYGSSCVMLLPFGVGVQCLHKVVSDYVGVLYMPLQVPQVLCLLSLLSDWATHFVLCVVGVSVAEHVRLVFRKMMALHSLVFCCLGYWRRTHGGYNSQISSTLSPVVGKNKGTHNINQYIRRFTLNIHLRQDQQNIFPVNEKRTSTYSPHKNRVITKSNIYLHSNR